MVWARGTGVMPSPLPICWPQTTACPSVLQISGVGNGNASLAGLL